MASLCKYTYTSRLHDSCVIPWLLCTEYKYRWISVCIHFTYSWLTRHITHSYRLLLQLSKCSNNHSHFYISLPIWSKLRSTQSVNSFTNLSQIFSQLRNYSLFLHSVKLVWHQYSWHNHTKSSTLPLVTPAVVRRAQPNHLTNPMVKTKKFKKQYKHVLTWFYTNKKNEFFFPTWKLGYNSIKKQYVD